MSASRFCAVGWLILACGSSFFCSSGRIRAADVTAAAESGFAIQFRFETSQSCEDAYLALTEDVAKWWLADHTYSGDSSNLYIEAKEKGWFGERLPNDGICCHLQVVFVNPNQEIRFAGGLGPLQPMGANGTMTWLFEETEEGSVVTLLYNVSGFSPEGMQGWAPVVDAVLAQQLNAFRQYLDEE